MKSARFLVVCLIFVFVCVSIASAQLYRFERASASSANQDDTGTYQSGNAMNNYGAVTGRYLVLNFGYFGAFTYGPPQILSNLSSAPLIRIRTNDMNDSRVTVGGCGYSANNPVNYTPCYWGAGTTEPTAMITDQNGYVDGEAIGINNYGKVVGFYREATGTPHPFVRDSAGDVIHLAGEGSAEGINDSSEVVGYTDGHGFIWDAQNGQRLLNTHIGNTGIWNFRAGLKINSQGHILGKGDTNFQEANFYWDGETVWFLGYTATYTVNGMNDYGEVVGSVLEYNPETFLMEQKGWRWDKNNGLKMLNNIAPTDGEWFWSNAADINNSGQILADGDRPSDSLSRAWILTPKEVQPLIFIPGIGGSTLHLKNENGSAGENLWTSGIITNYYNGKLEKLSLNPVANPSPSPIVAVDPVGQVFSEPFYNPILNHLTTTEGYVQYDIAGDPRKRKIGGPDGCTGVPEGLKPTLFVFAYDWRNSNEEAAERLKEFVDCVRLFYPNQKVNMLTHSMGGLVARKYVLNHPNDHHIRKMVTTVAPWFGAPKAYDTMLTGAFLGKNGAYFHYQAVKNIVQFGKGAHELLPSTRYYSASNVYPFGIQSFWGDPIPYDYWKTFEYFDNKYSGKPYTNSSNFHEYPGQDNWRDDTSGINYFHLYGVQNCHVTPGQVFALGDYALPLNPSQLWFRVKVNPTPGDKTVPKISADRPSNTLAPGTQVREYKPSTTQCTSDYEVEHTKILANPRVWNDISDILEDRPLSPPGVAEPEGETGNDATGLNYLSVMGVDRLDLTDDQDNSNTPITDIADQALEDVDYEYGSLASETAVKTPHRVTFGTEKTLDIKFTAQTQKIYIELSQGKSPETAGAAIKYLDLDLPAGVRAQLRFTTKGVENLRYDGDGDGEFETEVQPTFVLTDEAAGDTKEPQIQVSYTVTGNVATVTATATDAETGVEYLRYFIDGDTTDHIYDSPFTLNMDQTRMVYFAAQDNAGNRKLILKWVDLIPPVTAFSQTAPPNAAGWNTSDTTVELRSTDDVGGSGVSTLTYGGSGDQFIPTATLTKEFDPMSFPHPWTAADSLVKTLTMHHEGITDLNYYAVDKGGNTETLQTRTIRIDKTLPITTHELSDNGTLTTITLTANDVISGVYQTLYSIDGGSYQVYSAPFTVSSTGGHYVRYYSKDVAGNDETPRTVFIHPEDVASSVLISEFRARGYLGADDEFIELYNNGDTAVDISGWTINVKHGSNTTPVLLATIAGSIVIPPRGHYLLRKDGTSNYSLSGYAGADQTYTGALGDNCGIKLVSTSSTTIDAVGFASVTDSTYREGTGITPSAGITTSGQYSFARNFSVKNLPIDSNNSKNDFLFVSTDAATYNNLKSILGSPGPENLSSQVYREGAILVGQVDDTVTLAESPNRLYNYSETDPVYPVGTISVRRRLFNNTGQTITQMRLRVTAVTTKNSAVIFPTQAVLRLLNTTDMTVMTADGNWEIELDGITVDGVPTAVNGGLNSSYLINLGPNGLLPDETVNINLKAGIVTNGQYKLEFRFETVQ